MLAVTEVNGCAICSYAHTKIALEQGMGKEEINKLLAGDVGDIPEDQAVAIFFAQHYADKRGNPSKKAWLRLVNEYGKEKALGILGTIRMIMVGNIIFIPVGALISRFKGQAMEESSLPYELGMFLSILVFLPMILVEKIIAKIARLFWKR